MTKKVYAPPMVIDIETIPLEGDEMQLYKDRFETRKMELYRESCAMHEDVKASKSKASKSRAPKRPELKSDKGALHWLTGRVVCVGLNPIGFLDEEGKQEDPAVVIINESEQETLQQACDYIAERSPALYVTFNGINFDFPFLVHRAGKYGIELGRYLSLYKYDQYHCDIYEKFGGKWGVNGKLEEYAHHYGCYNLLYGRGSQVEGWWRARKLDEITKHCMGDILVTGELYMKNKTVLTGAY
jgi:DNA polymerase elongation subunit (family B)